MPLPFQLPECCSGSEGRPDDSSPRRAPSLPLPPSRRLAASRPGGRLPCDGLFMAAAVFVLWGSSTVVADDAPMPGASVTAFFASYCNDCHGAGASEGGLDLSALAFDLHDKATFSQWERIFDRVRAGEMPPEGSETPSDRQRQVFARALETPLANAHASTSGAVLRRLNRREYENTMNDLFGVNLDLAGMLPEDGKAQEFDNIGAALGLSMVHLQRYMDAAALVLDTSIANATTAPAPKRIEASYLNTREADKFVGRVWKKLPDGAVVRFSQVAYPSGMIRGTRISEPGRYRIRVTGYAHQSDDPITFSVGGTSFERGSEKPIYGFWSFPPGRPGQASSIEFATWIEKNYMIAIEPYGIHDPDRYKRKTIEGYPGPGLAILNVTMEGPLVGQWPSPGHRLIYDGVERREIQPRNPADKLKRWYKPAFEIVADDENAVARLVLNRVAEAAFRRPTTDDDTSIYLALFKQQRTDGTSIEESLRTAVIAIFCSPEFLYLQEQPGALQDHALASRLAYFLTRTTPDRELLEQAAAGKLASDADALRVQAERLLKSRHFERFLVDFTDNWLGLRDIDFTIPDRGLFPEFDAYLRHSMPLETRAFLRELIDSNLPVSNLVKSDFAMLNSRLATHYDLPPVTGAELRKVRLPKGSVRGGLLAQGSILKVTANGTNTSPVTRGAWVMERLLGSPPPPPPPGVPGVEPDIRGATTLRELLDKHRSLPACNACHTKIDPPGFALESFNPIGGFRDRYRSIGSGDKVDTLVGGRSVRYRLGPPVDSSGRLPTLQSLEGEPRESGDREFANFNEFRDLLVQDQPSNRQDADRETADVRRGSRTWILGPR